jgi:two-component system nitrogen regulation response regulator NtrX
MSGLKYGHAQASTGENEWSKRFKYPVLLTGEKGSPFELVARTLAGHGAAWVTPAKPEQLLDGGVELLQKAQQGVLYLGDVSQLSIAAQRAVVDLIQKADQYPARIVAYCSRPLEEMLTQSEYESDTHQCLCKLDGGGAAAARASR